LLIGAGQKSTEIDAGRAADIHFKQMFAMTNPAQAQFLLGRASYEAALFPQAEESFWEGEKLDPHYAGLHLALGKLYISERRTDDAVKELGSAVKENASNEDASYFLGSLLVQEARYTEGIPFLQHAKELKPDSWAVYFYLGKAELRLEKPTEAVGLLKMAVALNPEGGAAQYQLGRALEAYGEKAAAAQAFSKARELKADELKGITIPGVRRGRGRSLHCLILWHELDRVRPRARMSHGGCRNK
jgi:tetratricopeptide (TPR) repeat protein